MLVKFLAKPSIFLKSEHIPRIYVLFDDHKDAPNFGKKHNAFIIRRKQRFWDTNLNHGKLAGFGQHLMSNIIRGVIIDIRHMATRLDSLFVMHVFAKWAWIIAKRKMSGMSGMSEMSEMSEMTEMTLYFWGDKGSSAWMTDTCKRISCMIFARELASKATNMTGGPKGFVTLVQKQLGWAVAGLKICVIEGRAKLQKEGLGLIAGVGQGSDKETEPCMLVVEYQPKTYRKETHPCICLVGKGVCIDTGGYDMKSSEHMLGMNTDKTGASIVAGIITYISTMKKMRAKVIAVLPLVENRVSGHAIVPGDVLTAHNGLTVEVINTDAEGRLIVADGLAYACNKYEPDLIIDIGTFTGWSSKLHFGIHFSYYTGNDTIADAIERSAQIVGERGLRLPVWDEYMDITQGKNGNLCNANPDIEGSGGHLATLFLKHFVPENIRNRWVHFDIANNTVNNACMWSLCNSMATCIEMIHRVRIAK